MQGSRRRARVVVTLVGGALAVAGAVAVGAGLEGQQPAPPPLPRSVQSDGPPRDPATGDAHGAAGHDKAEPPPSAEVSTGQQPPALDYAEPVRVRIPSIGVSSGLVHLGLDPEGVMETPQDPDQAGWFTPSPAPGVPGASVIAGHVTWNREPVVFFRLGDLREGDRVQVRREDGSTAVFEVYRLGQFPKKSFPTQAVYGQVERPELRLITCGGGYDEQTNSYRANLVVWARTVAARR